jgi:hypothetical protein
MKIRAFFNSEIIAAIGGGVAASTRVTAGFALDAGADAPKQSIGDSPLPLMMSHHSEAVPPPLMRGKYDLPGEKDA